MILKTNKLTRLTVFVAVMVLMDISLDGQEMPGLAFSLYSGISSAAVNPAMITGSRVYLDVNIVSADVSFANNMVYFLPGNKTLSKAIRLDESILKDGSFKWGRSFNYYNNKQEKYFASSIKVMGPSVMLQSGRHAFGLTMNFRSFHSGNHIPYQIPVITYESFSFPEFQGVEFNDDEYSFVSMSWSETGLSYAYDFYNHYGHRLTFGITLKALFGYEGAYVLMRNANYVIIDSRSIDFKNLDADVGYALPVGYGNELTTNFEPLFKGQGIGADVGFVFTKLKSTLTMKGESRLCAKPYKDYQYKIGFSILDIGSITFTNDAKLHEFNNVSKYWIDFDTIHFRGIDSQMRIYSEGFYGDPEASYSGNKIKIGLPAALSLQFDYHLKKNIYLSAWWMHPLRFNARTLWRPAQLFVAPRFENRFIGISLPVSLYNYTEPRIGLTLRFYSVTVGTDRLGALLGISNFDGMDVYFSIKFNIEKGVCSSSKFGACSNSGF